MEEFELRRPLMRKVGYPIASFHPAPASLAGAFTAFFFQLKYAPNTRICQ
jgi:hypothetical protein